MNKKHLELIEKFYKSLEQRDYQAITECYHPEVEFNDPVFQGLRGARVTTMWRMLTQANKGSNMTYRVISADDQSGKAHWEPAYTFSQTGRKVLNKIDSEFQFKDGLIINHRDSFSLWKWASQALGPLGLLLGWSPPLRNKIRKQAGAKLEQFISQEAATRSKAGL
jgi:hypothetical protein